MIRAWSRLLWMVAPLCLAACPHEGPAQPRPAPVVHGSGAARAVLPDGGFSTKGASCFVGELVANETQDHVAPADYCVAGQRYQGADYRLSRLNLFGVHELPPQWLGHYVMVLAVRRQNLAQRLEFTGPCPAGEPFPIQARNDWHPAEGGYLTTREVLSRADYLEAKAEPQRVTLVSIRRPEPRRPAAKAGSPPQAPIGEVEVELRNPFDARIDELRVVFHYEGGPGKPLPYYDSVPVVGLAPGASISLRRAAAIERPTRQGETSWWTFASVALEGTAGDCQVLPNTFRR